jgi:Flp pilus assembly pilin Flp
MEQLRRDGGDGWLVGRLRRLAGRTRALRRDQRGTTAVEFALIGTVLVFLLTGIVEFSLIMVVNNSLDASTSISSRVGKTGFVDTNKSREQTILEEIDRRIGSLIDVNDVHITSESYAQFDQIGKPEPWNDANHNGVPDPGEFTDINGNGEWDADMGKDGFGGSDDVVVYTITYDWHVLTPLLSHVIGGNDGAITLKTTWVVKNEPF